MTFPLLRNDEGGVVAEPPLSARQRLKQGFGDTKRFGPRTESR